MLSIVVPVYNNEGSLPRLLTELGALASRLDDELEVVFVVDGSPDGSLKVLQEHLPTWPVRAQLPGPFVRSFSS
jgi:glycosyltransferase involved in cell wall biosynthesis